MPRVQFHDVNPFLQRVRDFLLGRKHTLALRFRDLLATRSPPPPVLPDGPAHKLNTNYYYSRDARREVKPPEVVASGTRQQIEEDSNSKVIKRLTPGKVWQWD
ncbi:hypothetical protein ABEB36_006186 [Hypothenemus hampei]|uniref:NADH dehydrogenase [ubiquinone] 1 alpha subcomplex subunit 7 n=1 Tax=Hypothenemus hampei TaxID=57062 RepID=A0ABD1EQA2_HYPHA